MEKMVVLIKYLRILQAILLLPSTLTSGLCAFILLAVSPSLMLGTASEYLLRFGLIEGSLVWIIGFIFLITISIPGIGFVMLWWMILKGYNDILKSKALIFIVLIISFLSLCIGGYLLSLLIKKETSFNLSIIMLFAIPLILGTIHLLNLIRYICEIRLQVNHGKEGQGKFRELEQEKIG